MSWNILIAFVVGFLLAACVPWILRRIKGKSDTLSGYTPEQAEKERERITGHAESERDKLKEESEKAKDRIDDFFED